MSYEDEDEDCRVTVGQNGRCISRVRAIVPKEQTRAASCNVSGKIFGLMRVVVANEVWNNRDSLRNMLGWKDSAAPVASQLWLIVMEQTRTSRRR
jgi:hypothetical protein